MFRPLIALTLTAQMATLPIDVANAQAPAAPASSEVSLERPPGTIAGTLLVPAGTRPPLVILIAGSGPTDRNGNTVGMPQGPESLRQLAESLAVQGIASFRYDKRGVGGSRSSAIPEKDLRFETLGADVAAWIAHFKADQRFGRIVVAGHSEGALLGLLALQQTPADGYISIAGPARRADAVLREQLAAAPLPPPLRQQADSTLAELVAGREVANPPAPLVALFRPSVQPYLISWFRYSGEAALPKWNGPCLIVQGTHDVQVAASEADLLSAAKPACRVARIEGMNHVLKRTPAPRAEQLASYSDPTLPLAPGVVAPIVSFVRSVAAAR